MSELTVQYLVLERRDPARNMARFYVLAIEPTLFGDTALVREWGRLGGRGRRRLDLFDGHVQAVEALESWLRRKTRRGYVQRHFLCAEPVCNTPQAGRSGQNASASISK
ncbi:WGR domain-containing protein [Bradyrhizobium sp. 61]|uniref:WGR domain-containing protein n=1 Tax=unclassified Bradyrhizobium TaxID=2631580 RepID=UPI0031F74B69|nr:WGR domain-containing protein [Bradyrhizobium sp. 61]MCK1440946.1 WGR domain-containing protein [Bradyrhizobium sp. 48]MCK1465614.1 WGR domain-containing protein [Bradyrhizobium sp. 2]